MANGFVNDVMFAKNGDFTGDQVPVEANGLVTDGQLWIGSTALNAGGTHINVGSITSNTIDVDYDSPNITLEVNAGSLDVLTANATPQFLPSGPNLQLDFGLSNLALGSSLSSLTSGTNNASFGLNALSSVTSGIKNVAVGSGALSSLTVSGGVVAVGYNAMHAAVSVATNCIAIGNSAFSSYTSGSINGACVFIGSRCAELWTNCTQCTIIGANAASGAIGNNPSNATGVGFSCLSSLTTGNDNCTLGVGGLQLLQSGSSNTTIGHLSGQNITTGSNNIFIGWESGISYTSSESSNIIIGNTGTLAESNVIRIGTQGSGSGQQTQCYLAGVLNTVSGRVVKTTVPGAYPYTTLTTDYVIFVDTSSARTINLIASPVTGTTYRIKDNVGSAAANNITITPAAGTIDGAATYTINSNWGSVDLIYSGSAWRVL